MDAAGRFRFFKGMLFLQIALVHAFLRLQLVISSPAPSAVFPRRNACGLLKHLNEVALIKKPSLAGNIRHGAILSTEVPLCLIDSDFLQIVAEGKSGFALEQSGKIGRGKMRLARHLVQREAVAKVQVNI